MTPLGVVIIPPSSPDFADGNPKGQVPPRTGLFRHLGVLQSVEAATQTQREADNAQS